MLSISLGPLALPVTPLVLLLAVWAASWVAGAVGGWRFAPGSAADAAPPCGSAIFTAAALGLATARGVHLALNMAAYTATPLALLDLRDGGWHAPSGLAAAAAWLLWRGWKQPACRSALGAGALMAALVGGVGLWATGLHDAVLPDTRHPVLGGGPTRRLPEVAAGRPVVINLWASWCGPCRQEMPALAAAQARQTGVGLIFVNQGETEAAVQAYLSKLGLPLKDVLLDPGAQLGRAVGSRALPTTLFYDAQGRLVDTHVGVLSAAALQVRLRSLGAKP